MALKRVPIAAAFAWGFGELARHLKFLLPLSALFFLPDAMKRFGAAWPAWLLLPYQSVAFFVILIKAVRLSQPKRKPPKAKPVEFMKGELVKWGFQLGGGLLGLCLALPFLYFVDGVAPAGLKAWFESAPWPARLPPLLLLLAPAVHAHVQLNFFGYILADKGGKAGKALKESSRLGRGLRAQLWLFYSLCAACVLLGLKLWIIGAVYTFPATVLATIYVYRGLSGRLKP